MKASWRAPWAGVAVLALGVLAGLLYVLGDLSEAVSYRRRWRGFKTL